MNVVITSCGDYFRNRGSIVYVAFTELDEKPPPEVASTQPKGFATSERGDHFCLW